MNRDELDEARRHARNLAKNAGYRVFPCGKDKAPVRPKSQGGSGFRDAATDPDRIDWLWRNWPGNRIGVATGAVSDISVLDIDDKHDAARAWWKANEHRIPPTRAYRTPGGGVHLYYRHHPGLRCSTGSIAGRQCEGIDCRADGGYIIFHFAAGLPCLDHSPPVTWPDWLIRDLQQPRQSPRHPYKPNRTYRPAHNDRPIAGIINAVASAPEGTRNQILYWAGRRLAERGVSPPEAEALLLPAAISAGLRRPHAIATIHSSLRGGAP